MMFQKLILAIFFYAFLNTVTKTEGGLITDFTTFREYTNIRSNYVDEKSVQRFRQLKNTAKQDGLLQPVKQLVKSHTPRFTEKSKRWNMNGLEANKENTKSSMIKNTGPKDIDVKAGVEGQPAVISQFSSTRCGTRKSVATITRVGDQTADPNRITTPFVPFTPRTRTQPRSTSIGSNKCSTKKWKCNEEVEDEPATDASNTMETLRQDITLPTRLPKHPTPKDPVTKLFLKMTSTDRWGRRPADECTTKPY